MWVSQRIETSVLELSDGSAQTCSAMLQRVAAQSPANAGALAPLMDLLDRNALPLVTAHPLWLAMAIDLALQGHAGLFETPCQLYEEWTCWKFLHDMDAAGRELPPAVDARGVFAHTMSQLMLEVAVALCDVQEGRLELREEVAEDRVVQLARALIPSAARLDPLIAQTSLLMPTSIRTTKAIQLRFSHYSFQEFYTAQAIAQGRVDGTGLSLPAGVQGFLRG